MSIPQRLVLDPDRDALRVPPTYRSTVLTAVSAALVLCFAVTAGAVLFLQPNTTASLASWVGLGAVALAAASWIARVVVVVRARSNRLTLVLSAVARASAVIVGGVFIVSAEGSSSGGCCIVLGAIIVWLNGRVLAARLRTLRS